MKPVLPTPPLPPWVNTTRFRTSAASSNTRSFFSGTFRPPRGFHASFSPHLKGIGGGESEHHTANNSKAHTDKGSEWRFWTGRGEIVSVRPGRRWFSV